MTSNSHIARIRQQESALVLDRFDEHVAFEIGSALRMKALAEAIR